MSYDARLKEVLEALEKTDHEQDAKDAMRRSLESYFREREGRLENLAELLEPGRGQCHGDWIDKAKEAAAKATDIVNSSEKGKLWLGKISHEEHTFFFKIMTAQIPVKRDRMVKQTQDLAKAEKEFEDKWNKIRDSDQRIDDQMKKVAEEYGEILEDVIEVAVRAEKESKEKMADLVEKGISMGLKAVTLGIAEPIIQGAAKVINAKLSEVKARKLEIHALLSREEGVYGTFTEAREAVEAFLQETKYPMIKDTWEQAQDAAGKLAGAMLTDGQKADSAEFGTTCKNELAKVFSEAEKAYKAFAQKHEYLFFGPLGGEYYQELYEGDTWKSFSERWKSSKHDIDDILRDRYFSTSSDQILEVSLSGLSSEDKDTIRTRLSQSLQELLRAWNAWKEFSDDPYWVLKSRESLKSIIDPLR